MLSGRWQERITRPNESREGEGEGEVRILPTIALGERSSVERRIMWIHFAIVKTKKPLEETSRGSLIIDRLYLLCGFLSFLRSFEQFRDFRDDASFLNSVRECDFFFAESSSRWRSPSCLGSPRSAIAGNDRIADFRLIV